MGRCFHLTKFGNEIVASNIIGAMISEQSKMMNQPADPTLIDPGSCPISKTTNDPPPPTNSDPPPPPPEAPYVLEGGDGATIGKCHVHVNELQTCAGDEHNLAAEVTIGDVGGNQIGFQKSTEAGALKPLSVNSKLEAPLVVTPEHRGDYVQFALGTENFDSTQADQTALSWCSTGGWDPKEGPGCGRMSMPSVSVFRSFSFLSRLVWSLWLKFHDRNGKWTVISNVHTMAANHLIVRFGVLYLFLGSQGLRIKSKGVIVEVWGQFGVHDRVASIYFFQVGLSCTTGFPALTSLLASSVLVTTRLFGVVNRSVSSDNRPEQSPEQVLRDLTIVDKRCKTGRGRYVGSANVL